MNTKLTLSLEKTVIEDAKSYAKKTGRSLSEMVENYFKSLVSKSAADIDENEIDQSLKKLVGIIELPPDFDIKKARDEHYKEKYGL
ncbi:DUF6364 family protein [Flavobacterium nackdongense]|uniref:Antitoxin n=1 Tax=Flavobacterium nackdongense TaxID=2547394 RepID=A0A4P6YHH0_9FLAO|nr:DUF6364 family protein [Flavobacterium nackdongense]QBN19933.1 hypothetical protein E1750_14375 [Flavobacterium nackdongense]